MKLKTMVIGLGPEYNYNIKDSDLWGKYNTRYASNHGASLISRTLINFFDADYIDDFSKVENYKKNYDLCVIAFATHITDWRDVAIYTNFVKKLGVKTVAFSLGIQDYSASSTSVNTLHSSIKDLLDYVIASSGFVGVRGPNTASVLIKAGYNPNNIVRIGCPTLFNPLNKDYKINKPNTFKKPLIVFHSTMANLNTDIIGGAALLGQDFLDEVVFCDYIDDKHPIKKHELENFKTFKNGDFTLEKIKENGIFYKTFDEWFEEINKYDFVLGARLHGCIAALIQGIPAVMITRDIRVEEIANFFKIPFIRYEDVENMTIEDIYNKADFSEFNALYSKRFSNFLKLMDDLDVLNKLSFEKEVPKDYWFSREDLNANDRILFDELVQLSIKMDKLEAISNNKFQNLENKLAVIFQKINKIPGLKYLKKLL